jgi:hypothetical protein
VTVPVVDSFDAPWLGGSDRWATDDRPAGDLRPGWYVYAASAQRFVAVESVMLRGRGESRQAYIDLADGRTLVVQCSTPLTVRHPAG